MIIKANPRLLVATFSLLLPGLGQLYQRRPVFGLAWFAAFTLLNLTYWGRGISPLLVAFAAFEAYSYQKQKSVESERGRDIAFTLVGCVGCFLWVSLIAATWLPYGKSWEVTERADQIARTLRKCAAEFNSGYPESVEECAAHLHLPDSSAFYEDPWGTHFGYSRNSSGFELKSAGPDRVFGTSDDYSYRYR